ncbi:hypothetical protein XAB3213_20026 [Xanthomonas citri pv. bilvae]|nr:hypothetical protein XAB3213_20026 [Xanthomonas citri pv. bilvae]
MPIRQSIAMNREALQRRGFARNAAAFACDAQHAIAQVMVRATGLKRAQTVRCARAMLARSNTRTACHTAQLGRLIPLNRSLCGRIRLVW